MKRPRCACCDERYIREATICRTRRSAYLKHGSQRDPYRICMAERGVARTRHGRGKTVSPTSLGAPNPHGHLTVQMRLLSRCLRERRHTEVRARTVESGGSDTQYARETTADVTYLQFKATTTLPEEARTGILCTSSAHTDDVGLDPLRTSLTRLEKLHRVQRPPERFCAGAGCISSAGQEYEHLVARSTRGPSWEAKEAIPKFRRYRVGLRESQRMRYLNLRGL